MSAARYPPATPICTSNFSEISLRSSTHLKSGTGRRVDHKEEVEVNTTHSKERQGGLCHAMGDEKS